MLRSVRFDSQSSNITLRLALFMDSLKHPTKKEGQAILSSLDSMSKESPEAMPSIKIDIMRYYAKRINYLCDQHEEHEVL